MAIQKVLAYIRLQVEKVLTFFKGNEELTTLKRENKLLKFKLVNEKRKLVFEREEHNFEVNRLKHENKLLKYELEDEKRKLKYKVEQHNSEVNQLELDFAQLRYDFELVKITVEKLERKQKVVVEESSPQLKYDLEISNNLVAKVKDDVEFTDQDWDDLAYIRRRKY